MNWQQAFHVAHVHFTVSSNDAESTHIIQPLLALYATSSNAGTLHFQFNKTGNQITLSLNEQALWSGTDAGEVVAGFEVHLYTRILEQLAPELISLHAAAIRIQNHACLFAGVSGAGKSSTCTQALLAGHAYLSDEFSLLSEDSMVQPFPRPLQWGKTEHPAFTHETMLASGLFKQAEFIFPDTQGKRITNLLWLPERVCHEAMPIRWLIFPRYDETATTPAITRIRRGEALMELPQHLHHRNRPDIMLQQLNQRLPPDTQFYRCRFSNIQNAWAALSTQVFNQAC